MARITYTNKTTAATSPLPATQKLTSGDANEIKASVNAAYDQIEEVAGEVAAIKAKELVALLSQSGTSAPTITIIKNTFATAPVLARDGAGAYSITITGVFADDASVMPLGSGQTPAVFFDSGSEALFYIKWEVVDANSIAITTLDTALVATDIGFSNIPIHITAK